MTNQNPTKKQRELLQFIDGFIKGYGYGPSYREVMRALEYKSVSTVATHINGLIARGWLVKRDHSARSVQVVMPGEQKVAVAPKAATAEAEIRAKLQELRAADGDHSGDIQALLDTLRLLGYEPEAPTQIA